MEIIEAAVHGIKKEPNTSITTEHSNDEPLDLDDRLKKLCEELLKIYGRTTNNYGTLSTDEVFLFPAAMKQYYYNKTNIAVFTKNTTHLIATEMSKSQPATGGYALFLRYNNQERDWLLVVMLKLKSRTGINEKTLKLNDSISFDLEHLHEAARIDVQKWQNNEQPYLSFIKRSGRQDEVTRYFRLALGCTDYTDSKAHTAQTLQAVKAYCTAQNFSPEQTRKIRQTTYEHLDNKWSTKEPVNLIALSAILNNDDAQSFLDFVRAQQYTINETFSPHKRTYSRFRRIQGEFGSVKVSFDASDLLDGKVEFDAVGKKLIIREVSQKLADDIRDAKGDANAD